MAAARQSLWKQPHVGDAPVITVFALHAMGKVGLSAIRTASVNLVPLAQTMQMEAVSTAALHLQVPLQADYARLLGFTLTDLIAGAAKLLYAPSLP